MTQTAAADAADTEDHRSAPSGESLWWTTTRVRRTMAGVGVLQLVVVGWIVQTSGFQQDDYLFFANGRRQGLTVAGLTESVFGSLIPGFNLVNAALAAMLPVSRLAVVVLTLAMYATLVFVFYRLLELLFGARPGIVLLTAIGTCSGLLGVSLVWWTPTINGLPAIIADIVAFDGLVRHAVTGRVRHLVVSVVSFAIGIQFYDPSMEILGPLVLVTLLYLCDLRDPRSIWSALRSRVWLWVGYLVPIAASLGWRLLHPGKYKEPPVGSIHQIVGFMVGGLAKGMMPSALGVNYLNLGPGWYPTGIIVTGLGLLAATVLVTLIRNPGAWRAWTLFLVSFLAADLVAAIGRSSRAFYFQMNSLYWAFFLFLFLVALGLSIFPSCLSDQLARATGGERARPSPVRRGPRVPSVAVLAAAVLCSLGIHYIWTTPDHELGAKNRVFTARLQSSWSEVSRHHHLAFVWDTAVPDFVMNTGVSARPNTVRWTMKLVVAGLRVDGGTGQGYLLDAHGGLVPARPAVQVVQAASSADPGHPATRVCLGQVRHATVVGVLMNGVIPTGHWFLRVHYSGSDGLSVVFNSAFGAYLPVGSGTALIPLRIRHASSSIRAAIPVETGLCLATDVERPVPTGAA